MALNTKGHVTREFGGQPFRFSSYTDQNCIGVAVAGATVAVLDSKDQQGPVLEFSRDAFSAFVEFARTAQV